MPKVQLQAKLVKVQKLKDDIYKFSIDAKEIVDNAKCGQFIEIRVTDNIDPFLRRPISIYNLDKENGILEFIFQVKGKGTEILARKKEGEFIDVIGPLGSGIFDYSKYENLAIIGGGIGIFPLYELAKEAKKDEKSVNIYLGFRNKDYVVLENEFKEISSSTCIATDDGSYGKNGFAINYLKEDIENGKIDSIYACGPMPMLRAIKELAIQKNIPCFVSLEEKMGCGIGVCLGCAVKKVQENTENIEYTHVCKQGPVFDATKVEF